MVAAVAMCLLFALHPFAMFALFTQSAFLASAS